MPADDETDVAALADPALRSAMEFAVGVAAAGQKLRPALVFPSGMKPYLKFSRLDRPALRAVRRAIAADADFRERIGGVATADLVDEIGVAWLQRADGWQQTVLDLQAGVRSAAAEASIEIALRRSEKRREAAEQATARATAELVGHHEALAREQTRRERAEQQAAAAVNDLTALRNELTGARRESERLRVASDTTSRRIADLESALAAASVRADTAEHVRDEVLASRALGAVRSTADDVAATASERQSLDSAAAARALRRAAQATHDVADALARAGQALIGDELGDDSNDDLRNDSRRDVHGDGLVRGASNVGQPARPMQRHVSKQHRTERRQPIPIPGGIYGNSDAASEHLLRSPGAAVIVDGYNVAKLAWPQLDLIEQRELCIDLLEGLARRHGTDVRVVFDGADVVGASSRRRLIHVRFSPAGVSADDVIRDEVRALPARTPVVVVTNDQAIVIDVRANGANVVASDGLLAVARRPQTR